MVFAYRKQRAALLSCSRNRGVVVWRRQRLVLGLLGGQVSSSPSITRESISPSAPLFESPREIGIDSPLSLDEDRSRGLDLGKVSLFEQFFANLRLWLLPRIVDLSRGALCTPSIPPATAHEEAQCSRRRSGGTITTSARSRRRGSAPTTGG